MWTQSIDIPLPSFQSRLCTQERSTFRYGLLKERGYKPKGAVGRSGWDPTYNGKCAFFTRLGPEADLVGRWTVAATSTLGKKLCAGVQASRWCGSGETRVWVTGEDGWTGTGNRDRGGLVVGYLYYGADLGKGRAGSRGFDGAPAGAVPRTPALIWTEVGRRPRYRRQGRVGRLANGAGKGWYSTR